MADLTFDIQSSSAASLGFTLQSESSSNLYMDISQVDDKFLKYVENNIARVYVDYTSYKAGEYVIYEHILYRLTEDLKAYAEWNPDGAERVWISEAKADRELVYTQGNKIYLEGLPQSQGGYRWRYIGYVLKRDTEYGLHTPNLSEDRKSFLRYEYENHQTGSIPVPGGALARVVYAQKDDDTIFTIPSDTASRTYSDYVYINASITDDELVGAYIYELLPVGERIQQVADTIVKEFDPGKDGGYSQGEYCEYQGQIYRFTTTHEGIWNDANVEAVTVADVLGEKADKTELPTIDSELSNTSANPVRNSAVKIALDGKADKIYTDTELAKKADLTYVDSLLSASDAMVFKGTLGTGGTVTALPAKHEAGWTYKVITAGTYAGIKCEIGDLIICIKDGTYSTNSHWTVAQTNIDGAVTGPASAVNNNIPVFDGATGKVIKDSGVSLSQKADTTNPVFNGDITGKCSMALGLGINIPNWYSLAFGTYNDCEEAGIFLEPAGGGNFTRQARGDYAEIVGNGISDDERSNARTLDWDGNERLMGDLYVGCNADSSGGTKVATVAQLPTIDSALSTSSTNPVQNKAVKAALDEKADKSALSKYQETEYGKGKINLKTTAQPITPGTWRVYTESWNDDFTVTAEIQYDNMPFTYRVTDNGLRSNNIVIPASMGGLGFQSATVTIAFGSSATEEEKSRILADSYLYQSVEDKIDGMDDLLEVKTNKSYVDTAIANKVEVNLVTVPASLKFPIVITHPNITANTRLLTQLSDEYRDFSWETKADHTLTLTSSATQLYTATEILFCTPKDVTSECTITGSTGA